MLADIIEKIKQHQPTPLPETTPQAAVMVMLLTDDMQTIDIVITKRTDTLPKYAGHYCFPGGYQDPEDKDLYRAAVRETQEELNILETAYQYLGQLDDFFDRYQHRVRPFVVLMEKSVFMKNQVASKDEIAELFFLPLQKLNLLVDDPNLHAITRRRPSYVFKEEHVFIWGLTATILVHLDNVITEVN